MNAKENSTVFDAVNKSFWEEANRTLIDEGMVTLIKLKGRSPKE